MFGSADWIEIGSRGLRGFRGNFKKQNGCFRIKNINKTNLQSPLRRTTTIHKKRRMCGINTQEDIFFTEFTLETNK